MMFEFGAAPLPAPQVFPPRTKPRRRHSGVTRV